MLAFASGAEAANFLGTIDDAFENPANWDSGSVPGPGEEAVLVSEAILRSPQEVLSLAGPARLRVVAGELIVATTEASAIVALESAALMTVTSEAKGIFSNDGGTLTLEGDATIRYGGFPGTLVVRPTGDHTVSVSGSGSSLVLSESGGTAQIVTVDGSEWEELLVGAVPAGNPLPTNFRVAGNRVRRIETRGNAPISVSGELTFVDSVRFGNPNATFGVLLSTRLNTFIFVNTNPGPGQVHAASLVLDAAFDIAGTSLDGLKVGALTITDNVFTSSSTLPITSLRGLFNGGVLTAPVVAFDGPLSGTGTFNVDDLTYLGQSDVTWTTIDIRPLRNLTPTCGCGDEATCPTRRLRLCGDLTVDTLSIVSDLSNGTNCIIDNEPECGDTRLRVRRGTLGIPFTATGTITATYVAGKACTIDSEPTPEPPAPSCTAGAGPLSWALIAVALGAPPIQPPWRR